MSKIYIEKLSEAYIRLRSSPDIEKELSQYFSFEMPGAKHTPLFKAKRWDGIVRLYNLKNRTIYAGLHDMVVRFAEQNEYETEFVPNEEFSQIKKSEIKLDREKIVKWVDSLDLHDGKGQPIKARDYQIDAFIHAVENYRSILLSPTASGKSLIIYLLVRWFNLTNKKMLLVVPSINLVQQMFNDFRDYSKTQEWNVEDYCQEIYGGKTKEITKSLTISTWQSLISKEIEPDFFEQFNVAFGDEAHLFAAKSLSGIMEKLVNARYRVATTGTIDEKSKVNILTLTGLFGPVLTVSTLSELMDEGSISKLRTKVLILKHPDNVRKVVSKYDYKNEIDYICCNQDRNKFIANLALATKGNTLILVNLVEKHAIPLVELLNKLTKGERKVFGIFGSASVEDIKKQIARENDCIIVASYTKFSTGANVPSIRNVIFGSPTKSYNRVLQSIGRGLRLDNGKDFCVLYDIVDDFSWKTKRNMTLLHGQERIKIYNQQKFSYKIIDVDL